MAKWQGDGNGCGPLLEIFKDGGGAASNGGATAGEKI